MRKKKIDFLLPKTVKLGKWNNIKLYCLNNKEKTSSGFYKKPFVCKKFTFMLYLIHSFFWKGGFLMKIFAPDYFGDFKCLMGDCKHSCCIGWEIDIDEDTAEIYKNIPGDFGKKLRENIDFGEDDASFVLCKDGRCPFLNEKGLCEIF